MQQLLFFLRWRWGHRTFLSWMTSNKTAAGIWPIQNLSQISGKPPTIWGLTRCQKKKLQIPNVPMKSNLPEVCPPKSMIFTGKPIVLWFPRRFQNPDKRIQLIAQCPQTTCSNNHGFAHVAQTIMLEGCLFTPVRCFSLLFLQLTQEFENLNFSQLPHWIFLLSGFLQPFIPFFCLASLHPYGLPPEIGSTLVEKRLIAVDRN